MKFKNQNKKSKNKYILILILILNLIVGCNSTSGEIQIDMKSVGDAASAYDDAIPKIVQLEQKEKYERHYQNGLYYEDFSKENAELNKKFEQYWTKYIKDYIDENILNFLDGRKINTDDMKWFIKNDVEYIKSDLKQYRNKKLKADDIVTNPNSIMSIDLKCYYFIAEGNDYDYSVEEDALDYFCKTINDIFTDIYDEMGVDFVNIRFHVHNIDLLKKHSIEDLKKVENISILEEKEGLLFDETKKTIDFLKKKYNKEFVYFNQYDLEKYYSIRYFYAPKDNSKLYFSTSYSSRYSHGNQDYFLSTMYQYELTKYVQKLIEESNLSDKVVFFIETEPDVGSSYSLNYTTMKEYNFGKGYKSEEFLKNGYFGDVSVTFINLKREDEKINFKQMRELVIKLDDFLGLKRHEDTIRKDENAPYACGDRDAYIYYYDIDDYGRKIAIDLFKKHQITEHEHRKEVLGLADIYSLSQITRAETPAFHYLDVFAKPEIYENSIYYEFYRAESMKNLRKMMNK